VRDGIGLSLFQATWNALQHDWLDLFSHMFAPGNLSVQQKRGVVVCVPKTTKPNKPSHYRPITLFNIDYKILARIIANRTILTLELVLHKSQYCGRPGNTIFEAIASVREAVVFAELKRKPLCILTFDFTDTFDGISHPFFRHLTQLRL
jgi:hypothetical protein